MTQPSVFPFSAVVGHDDMKLALLLNAMDRRIGGVLLRGQKGSAKSTLARALAALLPGGSAFVELPLSASEDRVVGSLDLQAALTVGAKRFHPGLLADADGGVLYVDEVNLLPDHLVDVLLDVAASGVNRVEREGMSESHSSRFVLVGSMNPEEGELRPQLLDRFGLSVEVKTPEELGERVEVVKRRDEFERDRAAFIAKWKKEDDRLRRRIVAGRKTLPGMELPDDVLVAAARLCMQLGTDGLRAELTLIRAARSLASLEQAAAVAVTHLRRVAPSALRHRLRRDPLDESGSAARIERALAEVFGAAESA